MKKIVMERGIEGDRVRAMPGDRERWRVVCERSAAAPSGTGGSTE